MDWETIEGPTKGLPVLIGSEEGIPDVSTGAQGHPRG